MSLSASPWTTRRHCRSADTTKFSNLSIVPLNKAPDIAIASSGDLVPVSLDATVTDDDYPLPVSLSTPWSQITGPGQLLFGNVALADTTSSSGSYSARLQANDGRIVSFKASRLTRVPLPSGWKLPTPAMETFT